MRRVRIPFTVGHSQAIAMAVALIGAILVTGGIPTPDLFWGKDPLTATP